MELRKCYNNFANARESLAALSRSQYMVSLPKGEWKGWLQGWTSLLGVGVAGFAMVAGVNAPLWAFFIIPMDCVRILSFLFLSIGWQFSCIMVLFAVECIPPAERDSGTVYC